MAASQYDRQTDRELAIGASNGDQRAFAAEGSREQLLQPEVTQGAKHRSDVAVREGADDLKGLLGGHQGLAFEHLAQHRDLRGRPVGEIGQGALVNLVAFPNRLAQQDGGGGVAVGDGVHIHGPMIAQSTL